MTKKEFIYLLCGHNVTPTNYPALISSMFFQGQFDLFLIGVLIEQHILFFQLFVIKDRDIISDNIIEIGL